MLSSESRFSTIYLLKSILLSFPLCCSTSASGGCDAFGPTDRLVSELAPGFNQTSECMFSGLVALPNTSSPRVGELFYTLYTAQNSNASDSPLILWFNGGPGTSCSLGALYELGPYRLNDNLTLSRNPYAWNTRYNLLFVDQPLGTGLSTAWNNSGLVSQESEVAQDMLGFLLQWFKEYPVFSSVPLYISGESYAGRFVPSVALAVHQHNQKQQQPTIKLRGISVGNGYSAPCEQIPLSPSLAFQAGLLDTREHEIAEGFAAALVASCEAGLHEAAYADIGVLIEYLSKTAGVNRYDFRLRHDYDFSKLTDFLSQPSVQKALHVSPRPYIEKNMTVFWHFSAQDQVESMAKKHATLLDSGIDVLIYHGQYDLTFTNAAEEFWVNHIEWEGQTNFSAAPRFNWRLAQDPSVVVGFGKSYQNLNLFTVLNAGHLVPRDQPASAWDLIDRFIQQKLAD